jgi:hypothetical protein
MNPSGSTLIARQTTFMPHKPGLGPILVMAFAPRVELRCDPKMKRYTGCIAGLGSREKFWQQPKDPKQTVEQVRSLAME